MTSTELEEIALVDALRGPMLAKLRANSHKNHWRGCDFRYLITRLRNETKEIVKAWRKARGTALMFNKYIVRHKMTPEERQEIINECADVANFACMVADLARRT